MQLFYSPNIAQNQQQITFDSTESKHIAKVLRKTQGDVIAITNGNGSLFTVQLTAVNTKQCVATIKTSEYKTPLPYQLHLAVAPTKMNDRFEWFLEKATEIGITDITPIICHNSERKIVKEDRFKRIIVSAMKQALHTYLPQLHPPVSFSEFVTTPQKHSNAFIAHCEPQQKTQLQACISANQKYTILIGPEGDFSTTEITQALQHHFKPVALGHTRLRTETAAIVATQTVAAAHY